MLKETVEDEIIEDVAKELGITKRHVRDIIVNGQSAYTKHVMETGIFIDIRWPGLGSFQLRPKYAMVQEHMKGLSPAFKQIFKQRIQNGSVFERKFEKIKDIKKNNNEAISN